MRRNKFSSTFCLIAILFISLITLTSRAENKMSWSQWVANLKVEAVAQGIRPTLFDEVFSHFKGPNRSIISYDHSQPEKRITFLKYRNTRSDNYRIIIGRRKYQKYKPLLETIGRQYNVNPCFIVSLWGLETSYGSYMGKFPVVQSLATLAYDSRRANFFHKQLLLALHILNEGHVTYNDFKGEWAGASGHPQFLPSSWHDYAVDYERNGRRDIWRSLPDVFASIANYLAKNGWQDHQPWAIVVKVPANALSFVNTKQLKPLAEWQALGVKTMADQPWPNDINLQAELIQPDGGPYFLTFNNFRVIMKWNRSNYYAGTVGYLAEQICGRPLY